MRMQSASFASIERTVLARVGQQLLDSHLQNLHQGEVRRSRHPRRPRPPRQRIAPLCPAGFTHQLVEPAWTNSWVIPTR
jgi:hypothetical protein